jgi:hypothetical protein
MFSSLLTLKAPGIIKKSVVNFLLFFSVSILLAACGGGGGGTGATEPGDTSGAGTSISGTAATGAAMSGSVYVFDGAGKTANTSIAVDGHYQVDVSGLTPPFVLIAYPDAGSPEVQYSYASNTGVVVNVTPLTTLALYLAYGQPDLDNIVSDLTSGSLHITQTQIDEAQASIRSRFASKIAELGLDTSFSFFSLPFNTDGQGLDGLLDYLNIAIDMQGSGEITINGQVYDFSQGTGTTDNASGVEGLGSLVVSGKYQELVSNPSFDPNSFQVLNSTNYEWLNEAKLESVMVSQAPDDASKAWSVTYNNGWTTVVELQFKGDTIFPGILEGVAITDKTVTFTDFTFYDSEGNSVVVFNGTLNRQ